MRLARADLALIGVTAIWGCTFLIVQKALHGISPVLFLGFRFALASVVLFAVYRTKLAWAGAGRGLAAGLFLFAGYVFQTKGLTYTTASKSAFLTSLSVPLVPLATSLVYKLIPKPFELLGVAAASAGMVLLTAPEHVGGWNRGDVLSFFCALAFAGQIVALSHAAGKGNFETLAFSQMMVTSIFSFASYRFLENPLLRWSPGLVSAILITGLLASALAFSVQAWAQQYTSATRAAIIFALEPLFAWLTSFLAMRETLGVRGTFGAGLILFGILIVELKRRPERERAA